MLRWADVVQQRPELAGPGASLLYQFGVGLAFLGTVRRDGGPRLHPMCPLLHDGGLYAFIVPSPKQRDLLRDGRFALHSFPRPQNEDAFYLTGRAERRNESGLRAELAALFVSERTQTGTPPPQADEVVFEFLIESVLWTQTAGHGDADPHHTIWRPAPAR